jgi:hypothetical protein
MPAPFFPELRRPGELRVACITCGAHRHVDRTAIAGDTCSVCGDPGWIPVALIDAVCGKKETADPTPDLLSHRPGRRNLLRKRWGI